MHGDTRIYREMRALGALSIIRPHGQRHYNMVRPGKGMGTCLAATTGPPDGQFGIGTSPSRRPAPWYTNQVNSEFHNEMTLEPFDYPWTMLALIYLPDASRQGCVASMWSSTGGGNQRCYGVGSSQFDAAGNNAVGLAYNESWHGTGVALGLGWMQYALRMPNSTSFQFVKNGVQIAAASPPAMAYAANSVRFTAFGVQSGSNARLTFPVEWIALFPTAVSDAHLSHLARAQHGVLAGSVF